MRGWRKEIFGNEVIDYPGVWYMYHDEIKKRNYLESDNLSSVYPYDLSKTCSDLICQSYSKVYNLKVAIVRCGNLYGPGDFNENRIIPETIISAIKNKAPRIINNNPA